MEIEEHKSHEFLLDEIKNKLNLISDIIKSNYNNELVVYKYNFGNTYYLAENIIGQKKICGRVIHKYKISKDLAEVSLSDGTLRVFIIDRFIYPIMKKEFTDFAEIYKENIKKINFISDF